MRLTCLKNCQAYFQKSILPFFGLGISVQAPINLMGGLLMLWTTSVGLNLTKVGLFALVTLPYSLKFLWAPFVDRIDLSAGCGFGQKKFWCLLFQLGILMGLCFISTLDPVQDTKALFWTCLVISTCAASQEMTVDSLRIDTLNGEGLKKGTVLFQLGTRIGYFAATAGMIALSAWMPWNWVYRISMAMIIMGILSVQFIQEPKRPIVPTSFKTMVADPFMDLVSRRNLLLLCVFIVLYKLCNGMLGKMAYPFYYDIGFTKVQISLVSATFGSVITTIGIMLGGVVLDKLPIKKLLIILGFVEILTSLAFAGLATVGPNVQLFALVIIFDNIVGGMGGAVWTVFLSQMCSRRFSATQYSFLNALTMIPLTLFGAGGGILAQYLGWPTFFFLTGVMMIPALMILLMNRRFLTS